MFDNLHYKWIQERSNKLSTEQVDLLENMIKLCDPNWCVERDAKNKSYWEFGVVTLRNGYRIERYPFLDLVLYKLAPVLFSNNKFYVRPYLRSAPQHPNPLMFLHTMLGRYYKAIKKQQLSF